MGENLFFLESFATLQTSSRIKCHAALYFLSLPVNIFLLAFKYSCVLAYPDLSKPQILRYRG